MDHSELLKRITARPDVPARQRIALIADVVQRHRRALEARAVVTIRGGRIRIAHPPVQ